MPVPGDGSRARGKVCLNNSVNFPSRRFPPTSPAAHIGKNCGTILRSMHAFRSLSAALLFGTTGRLRRSGCRCPHSWSVRRGSCSGRRCSCSPSWRAGSEWAPRPASCCWRVRASRCTRPRSSSPWPTPAWRWAPWRRSARRPRSPACCHVRSPGSDSTGAGAPRRGSPASGYACSCSPALPEGSCPRRAWRWRDRGAGYAGYAVAGKRMLDQGGTPEGVMAAVFCVAGILLLPVLVLGLVRRARHPHRSGPRPVPRRRAHGPRVHPLRTRARRIGASETATLTLAEPLTAAALGVIVVGEKRPGAPTALGAALVLAGLALLVAPEGVPAAAGQGRRSCRLSRTRWPKSLVGWPRWARPRRVTARRRRRSRRQTQAPANQQAQTRRGSRPPVLRRPGRPRRARRR